MPGWGVRVGLLVGIGMLSGEVLVGFGMLDLGGLSGVWGAGS